MRVRPGVVFDAPSRKFLLCLTVATLALTCGGDEKTTPDIESPAPKEAAADNSPNVRVPVAPDAGAVVLEQVRYARRR